MVQKGYSKAKGNSYENKIYKDLRGVIPDIKKTIGSGNSENDADLVSNDYVFELKRYKKVEPAMIYNWFAKVSLEAFSLGKSPILIYREDYRDSRVVMLISFRDITAPMTMDYEVFKEAFK